MFPQNVKFLFAEIENLQIRKRKIETLFSLDKKLRLTTLEYQVFELNINICTTPKYSF